MTAQGPAAENIFTIPAGLTNPFDLCVRQTTRPPKTACETHLQSVLYSGSGTDPGCMDVRRGTA
jgi:hypothetical protein